MTIIVLLLYYKTLHLIEILLRYNWDQKLQLAEFLVLFLERITQRERVKLFFVEWSTSGLR